MTSPSPRAFAVIGLAVVVRLAVFPFADNKHGDAPMRALIAERLATDPASAAIPRTYCQFGPLHTTLMRPFIALDPVASRSSRYLSLLAGIAALFPFLAFARRLVGPARAELALFALAVSPLHIQVSTTAASEALYLLLWVAALERLLAALDDQTREPSQGSLTLPRRSLLGKAQLRPDIQPREPSEGSRTLPRRTLLGRAQQSPRAGRLATFAIAGVLASLAAVTRYDAWLALPLVVASVLLFARGPRLADTVRGLAAFSAAAALLPAVWLLWNQRVGGDPFFFAHYISNDHVEMGAAMAARYGAVVARARQVGVWTLAFAAAMTLPGLGLAIVALARGWRALAPAMRVVVVAALGPPAVYFARGVLLLSFEPLARFALVPGALLLPLAATAIPAGRARRFCVATAASAAAFSIAIWLVATVGRDRIWAGAESMGALTRLDGEDRALAAYLRAHRPPGAAVMIEPMSFTDIGVAAAAGVPWALDVSLATTRAPRATLAATFAATGARFVAGYDRDGGWPRLLPDWPAADRRFGRWRLVER